MKGTLKKLGVAVAAIVLAAVSGFLVFTPFVVVEAYSWLSYPIVFETPKSDAGESQGVRWFDNYYAVERIDAKTFAIGEPRYYQGNYSYLILGERRAILFDSGPGVRDIKPVVEALTDLPVTVTSSHLHYDHVGNMDRFDRVAMLDLPELRDQVGRDGVFGFGRYEHLGFIDGIEPPVMRVTDWWGQGENIDLGGRTVRVLRTPGHTPYDMMLYDEEGGQLFTGDLIYPTTLLAFLPGSSRSDYLDSTTNLLFRLPPDTELLTGHAGYSETPRVPRLSVSDLSDLERTLKGAREGRLEAEGIFPRTYQVNDHIELQTGFSWHNR
jgi:glyoxylase-like metal-dependent hydrolase (beta-lactamase superfamily II)